MKRLLRYSSLLFLLLLVESTLSLWCQARPFSSFTQPPIQRLLDYPLILPMHLHSVPIHIVHLGDSHLQSGYLGDALRKTLSKSYSLAGYGLVSPYSLAGSNAPESYRYQSQENWSSCTLSYIKSCTPTPPCGILLQQNRLQSIGFTFSCTRYPFDQLLLFRGEDSPSLSSVGVACSLKEGRKSYSGMVVDTLTFLTPQRSVSLRSTATPQGRVSYGGALLLLRGSRSNDLVKKDLLYSQIGINGAMYANFAREEFIEALTALNPCYLLFSLGANESLAPRFSATEFKRQVLSLINKTQKALPQTQLILSTPAPNFKGRVFNKSSLRAAQVIREVAAEQNILLIDLYEFIGGEQGAEEKRKSGNYYNRDGVHFSIEGYHHQGIFFARELEKLLP